MTEFEIITLVLSIIAILLSGFNIYITFFHKKSSLIGNILSFYVPEKTAPLPSYINFECSLGNTGKRELLVREISLLPEETAKLNLVPIIKGRGIPCILKPEQIVLIKFDFPVLFANSLASKKIPILVEFEIASSNGKTYLASKKLEFTNTSGEIDLTHSWKGTFSMKQNH